VTTIVTDSYNKAALDKIFDSLSAGEFLKSLVLHGRVDILELPFSVRTSAAGYYVMAFRRCRGMKNREQLFESYSCSLSRDIQRLPEGDRKRQFQDMLDWYTAMRMEW
jgi:hypothetical protein